MKTTMITVIEDSNPPRGKHRHIMIENAKSSIKNERRLRLKL